jgi:hypothetical protein
MTLANSVMERCEDRSGAVIGVFHDACDTLGTVAEVARPDSKALAERAFRALCENNYGQYDYLIEALTPALGSSGLDHLKQYVTALSTNQTLMPRDESRQIIGWNADGPVDTEDYADRWRDSMIKLALQQIADAQGDVDAFIAQQSEAAKTVPAVAAEIAQRLLAAGRTDEAWQAINAVDEDRRGWIPFKWEQTRLSVLEALGRADEAQTFRWACFERTLEIAHLQAYLKRLPDFEDVEAEERALSLALEYADVHRALLFYVSWPAPSHAAELVLSRAAELDGYYYEILETAADLVEAKHPLAATVLLRPADTFLLRR